MPEKKKISGLLPEKSKAGEKRERFSRFRDMVIIDGRNVRLEALPKQTFRDRKEIAELIESGGDVGYATMIPGADAIVEDVAITGDVMPEEHHRQDAEIRELILKRAKRKVWQGTLRIFPQVIQRQGKEITLWSTYTHGASLDNILAKLSRGEAKNAYYSLMRNLGYLHIKAGVAHNDLRRKGGSNILMWGAKNEPHLNDFGNSVDLRKPNGTLIKDAKTYMLTDVNDAVHLFRERLSNKELKKGIQHYKRVLSGKLSDMRVKNLLTPLPEHTHLMRLKGGAHNRR